MVSQLEQSAPFAAPPPLRGVLGREVHLLAGSDLRARLRVGVEAAGVTGVHDVEDLVPDVGRASAHLQEFAHLGVDHPGIGGPEQAGLDHRP